jgi:hypothetical protein
MYTQQLVRIGLTLLSLFIGSPVRALDLSTQGAIDLKQNSNAVPLQHDTMLKKKRPLLNPSQLCPKLVAKELHVVRVSSQPGLAGTPAYRFVLAGTVSNRGAAGLAAAGLNVTQSIQGKPEKRIALKLFKQQAQHNQNFDLNGDLHLSIQSDVLSRSQATRVTFKLNVTNLRNDKGNCGEYRPTVATITSGQSSRALPAQTKGIGLSDKANKVANNSSFKAGFAAPAPSIKELPSLHKTIPGLGQHNLLKKQTGAASASGISTADAAASVAHAPGQIGHVSKPDIKPELSVQTKRRIPGFAPAPSPQRTDSKPKSRHGGFAQAAASSLQARSSANRGASEYLIIPERSLSMTGMGNGYSSSQVSDAMVDEAVHFLITPGASLSMTGLRENTLTIVPGGSLSMIGTGDGYLSSQVSETRIDKPAHFVITPGGKMVMTGMKIVGFDKLHK